MSPKCPPEYVKNAKNDGTRNSNLPLVKWRQVCYDRENALTEEKP